MPNQSCHAPEICPQVCRSQNSLFRCFETKVQKAGGSPSNTTVDHLVGAPTAGPSTLNCKRWLLFLIFDHIYPTRLDHHEQPISAHRGVRRTQVRDANGPRTASADLQWPLRCAACVNCRVSFHRFVQGNMRAERTPRFNMRITPSTKH